VSDVLQCLKKYGQRLDLEIAEETRVPLAAVRERLSELSAVGAVVMCRLTRYEGAKTIEAWQCRLSGFVPSAAPGRKPKTA
jgi:predicted ArsR family transcriptional regulator